MLEPPSTIIPSTVPKEAEERNRPDSKEETFDTCSDERITKALNQMSKIVAGFPIWEKNLRTLFSVCVNPQRPPPRGSLASLEALRVCDFLLRRSNPVCLPSVLLSTSGDQSDRLIAGLFITMASVLAVATWHPLQYCSSSTMRTLRRIKWLPDTK